MTLQLAIVLPTLNERGNLRPLVDRLDAALGDGVRSGDLGGSHGTRAIGDAVVARL